MRIRWFIAVVCVVVLATPSYAQDKPHPSEDFSSTITSSMLNDTEHIVAKGALFVNFGAKKKLDLDLDTGKQTLLDRFDQSLRYTIVANTCLKERTNSTPIALWGWLNTASYTGKCALEDQNGEQWTCLPIVVLGDLCNGSTVVDALLELAHTAMRSPQDKAMHTEGEVTTIGCFQDDIPIQLVTIEPDDTYMLVFTSFDPTKPDDHVFDPPDFCVVCKQFRFFPLHPPVATCMSNAP